ncbi:unnamed protein product [Aureobasidium vineae]|uniref:BTB domain-containing protein n=1 Tax=Aureobasidium vineae TaxID=2773715 RepID=A0A9N8PF20_9PEZI|nr:unnamed protein product [Aureobasidium vineae]
MPPKGFKGSKGTQEPTEAIKEEWARSTWNPEHVTYVMLCLLTEVFSELTLPSKIIAGSADRIQLIGNQLDRDNKIFSASVHKELLCFFSPYYTAALKGGFAEGQKSSLTLDLSNQLMADVVSWLYSGNTISTTGFEFLDLYVFADDRKILPQNSGLFRYLVDYWFGVWGRHPGRTLMAASDNDDQIPKTFFRQALVRFCRLHEDMPNTPPADYEGCSKTACNFHEHPSKQEWVESKCLVQINSLFLC